MSWNPSDLLPGLYLLLLGGLLAAALRRWYDPVPWRVWAVSAAVLALLFGPVLFGGGVLLPLDNLRNVPPFAHLPEPQPRSIPIHGDLVHQIAPWQLEVRRAFFDGRWPLWNSRAGAGMPLMGDPQSQALQPLVLAAWPLDLWSAAGVTASLRVLVALVFLFLLLRRQGLGEPAALGGSLAFALGGFLMLWLGWPMASSAAWLPAVLYALVRCDEEGGRRDHLLLSLAVFSLLLGGHPETIVYSLALSGLFLLARAREKWRAAGRAAAGAFLLRSGLALALGGALAAPVLLPVQDYIPKTHRAAVVAYNFVPKPLSELGSDLQDPEVLEGWRQRSVERLLPIAAPRAFGGFQLYWGGDNLIEDASGFAGTGALLLAALGVAGLAGTTARRRFPQERLMAGVLLGCLALIAQPPGLAQLLGQLPVVGATAIHLHHRSLLLVTFCIAWLAACEIERRARGEGRRWPVLVAAALLGGLLVWGYAAHPYPEQPELLAAFRQKWLTGQLVVLGVTAALLVLPWGRWGRWRPWALGSVLALELLVAHLPAHPPAPRRLAYPVTPPVRFLLERLGDDRMVGIGNTFLPNFPTVYGLNDFRVDNPSLPLGYAHILGRVQRSRAMMMVSARPLHPIYDLMGVRYLMTRAGVPLPLRLAFKHPAAWIYERPRPLPRLFLPEAAKIYRGGNLVQWLDGNPDFAARTLVQKSPERQRDWRSRASGASALPFSLPEPAHVDARALFLERRLLASSIYQDGHWRLLVDGEPRPSLYANGLFVAAWLPPGDWDVDLLYRPAVFVLGCLLAALALAAALAWWVPPPRSGVLS